MIQRHLWISGRVQGVGFRASTVREAAHYVGLKGWVKNLSDGRVEIVVSGPEGEVLPFIEWCHEGPPGSEITGVDEKVEAVDGSLTHFARR